MRDRLEDVGPALHAPVDDDARSSTDGLDDLGQRVEAAQGVVDLTAAVVRDPDVVHAVLDGDLGVLGGLHALEHERQPGQLLDHVHRVPGQARLPLALGRGVDAPAGRVPARHHRALAAAVVGDVDGQGQGGVAGVLDAPDDVLDPVVVAVDVELENLGRRGGGGGLLEVGQGRRSSRSA